MLPHLESMPMPFTTVIKFPETKIQGTVRACMDQYYPETSNSNCTSLTLTLGGWRTQNFGLGVPHN